MRSVTRSRLIVQPGSGFTPLVDAIRRARRTVDLAIFRLSAPEIQRELEAAVARGVKVRALVAHRAKGDTKRLREVEQSLLASGVTVARTAEDLVKYHGKYLLVDDTLHLMGFNFTRSNVKKRSFGIQSQSRRAVEDARRLFECDLAKRPFCVADRSPLVVSPETSRATLERFIAGARGQLAIYDAHLLDDGFAALILERAAAGVDVRVIGRAPDLEGAVPVRALRGLKLHVRAMVRDGLHVFVGSQSLRPLELDRRREVGLVIANAAVARLMLEIFEGDWEHSGTRRLAEREQDLEYAS